MNHFWGALLRPQSAWPAVRALLLLPWISLQVMAQNLVPNHSFESATAYPNAQGQYYLAAPWTNAGVTPATPDYFHQNAWNAYGLPTNAFGFTDPQSGNAVMGLVGYHGVNPYLREYIQCQLTSPMTVGQTYQVSFWVTHGDSSQIYGTQSSGLGVLLSTSPVTATGGTSPNGTPNMIITGNPQFEINSIIWHTSWTQYSFLITPSSAFDYLTIGNFRAPGNIQTQMVDPTVINATYYYLDNIQIIPAPPQVYGDTILCLGDSARLWAIGEPQNAWADSLDPGTIISTNDEVWVQPDSSTRYFWYGPNDTLSVWVQVQDPSLYQSFTLGTDTALCEGDTLTLSVDLPTSFTVWQSQYPDSIFWVADTGVYWVDYASECGLYSDTLHVHFTSEPIMDLGPDTLICTGAPWVLDVSYPHATYEWQDGSHTPQMIVSNSGTYHATLTDHCGQTASDTIAIEYQYPPQFELGNDTSICPGTVLTLEVPADQGTILWQDSSDAATFAVENPGQYWVRIQNACGDWQSDSINILLDPIGPIFELPDDTLLCEGQTLMLSASFPQSTYLWQDGSTQNFQLISQAGIYHLTITDRCGQEGVDSLEATYLPNPHLDLGNDTVLCVGDLLWLDASFAGASYVWQDQSTQAQFPVDTPGIYGVSLNHYCGSLMDTIEVFAPPVAAELLGPDTTICPNPPLVLDVGMPFAQYLWQDGSTLPAQTVLQPGLYTISIQHTCGTYLDTQFIQFHPYPIAHLGTDTSLCPGDTLWLQSPDSGVTYVWQDGSTDSVLMVTLPGDYQVEVWNQCGMRADGISIWEADCQCQMFIPNIFTPNGDQLNEAFLAKSSCLPQSFQLSIFNQWGQQVFFSNQMQGSWDGRFRGIPVPEGVYIYRISYQFEDQPKHMRSGSITLIR
ncbi:gliding motility-associated C-terminal domain-containing protein [Pontibacter sp. G13]|uniref:T9SS type B sorting domain-containing protein n=1 Tax=Pontibacter sp. G13 TaxID=3074898 RepID=UPI00288AC077|nr:gliding motility-associated C-terminal domain-containing protein [Pontibacter sp. G13]WNJ20491.1 gliding motility-associated C-terminal domain-containing protein [Pontibacter sp. G13]